MTQVNEMDRHAEEAKRLSDKFATLENEKAALQDYTHELKSCLALRDQEIRLLREDVTVLKSEHARSLKAAQDEARMYERYSVELTTQVNTIRAAFSGMLGTLDESWARALEVAKTLPFQQKPIIPKDQISEEHDNSLAAVVEGIERIGPSDEEREAEFPGSTTQGVVTQLAPPRRTADALR